MCSAQALITRAVPHEVLDLERWDALTELLKQ